MEPNVKDLTPSTTQGGDKAHNKDDLPWSGSAGHERKPPLRSVAVRTVSLFLPAIPPGILALRRLGEIFALSSEHDGKNNHAYEIYFLDFGEIFA